MDQIEPIEVCFDVALLYHNLPAGHVSDMRTTVVSFTTSELIRRVSEDTAGYIHVNRTEVDDSLLCNHRHKRFTRLGPTLRPSSSSPQILNHTFFCN